MVKLAERARKVIGPRQEEAAGREKPAAVADRLFVALDLFEHYSRQRPQFEGALRGCDRGSYETCMGLVSEAQRGFCSSAVRPICPLSRPRVPHHFC